MYIAVEGCCHGELDKIYETIQHIENKKSIKVEMLICCGDFEAIRNQNDLECMAVPPKYRHMQTFWQYYCGKKTAPVLTIFIGGNHEATNYLQELAYGGWVAPNIYYLGYAGVINFKGLRIGGLSGIFKQHDYSKGHFEKAPYSESTKRSAYHIRQLEVFRMCQIKKPIDIMLSHDWPRGVERHGDCQTLIRKKKHFKVDVQTNQLGSKPAMTALQHLQPKYWFSGHLHVKFTAVVKHPPSNNKNKVTKFLALDKCLPRRDFLQVIDVKANENDDGLLRYDAEWLAILKETNQLLSTSTRSELMPTKGLHDKWDFSVDEQAIENIHRIFGGDLKIPLNFRADPALIHHPDKRDRPSQPQSTVNPQTTEFCARLEINDPLMVLLQSEENGHVSLNNSSFITSDFDDRPSAIISNASINPDEIDLDDDDDEDDEDEEQSPKSGEGFQVIGEIDNCTDESNKVLTSTPVSKQLFDVRTEGVSTSKSTDEATSRSFLSLPPPVFANEGDNDEKKPKIDNSQTTTGSTDDGDASKEPSVTITSKSDDPTPKKRVFKRRNASLYANCDD